MMKKLGVGLVLLLSACSTLDPYQQGIRYFEENNGEMARQQWEPLAQAGDCDAQYRMGILYFRGGDVPRDYRIAHYWWLRAAHQGHPLAQALLANMYAHENTGVKTANATVRITCNNGCGYGKDLTAAYQWMQLAVRFAANDRARALALEKSAQYKRSLAPAQVVEADRNVEAWQPSPSQCVPRGMAGT